ncbi:MULTISPECIES: hypothetical protein [unclassified Akkermansia]|jgi:hypothetical protein|uniref:hypothetical protein n=1 Tax=Pseudomonadati TaxID=3379134 RepID=UPI0025E07B68|nr:hypothetical protein [uncultured Akkermansia sp.]
MISPAASIKELPASFCGENGSWRNVPEGTERSAWCGIQRLSFRAPFRFCMFSSGTFRPDFSGRAVIAAFAPLENRPGSAGMASSLTLLLLYPGGLAVV